MTFSIRAALIFASALFVSACGGGGGGGSEPTGPVTTNRVPQVTRANEDQTAQVGYDLTYDALQGGATFTDGDGDALTYTITFSPDPGDLSANSRAIITGVPSQTGDIQVSVRASDGPTGVTDTFIISVTADQDRVQARFGGAIDLNNLLDYATLPTPEYVRAPNTVANPVTNKGATLGRILFYDTNLSIDNSKSCASCHLQSNGFGDPNPVSEGVEGLQTRRNSMRLINTLWSDEPNFFWDERADSVEDQVTRPIRGHDELGFSGEGGRPTFDDFLARMRGLGYYEELFRFVFLDTEITEARLQSALGQFVNSIHSFDSRYDTGLQAAIDANPGADISDPFDPVYFSNFSNFTAAENAGKNLYMSGPADGGAGCTRCHAHPVFSVFQGSQHIGVIGDTKNPGGFDLTNSKSPNLRDLFGPTGAVNNQFMHDGSMTTMREVLIHYDDIPVPADEPLRTEFLNTIDPQVLVAGTPEFLMLTNQEMNQIESFLRTLTGDNIYTDEKWSDPF